STHSARFADQLLDQVRNRDLDQSGEKLTQVLSVASSLNLGALSDNRSRIPIIGPLLDKIRLQKNNFMSNFDSTSEQIEKLVGEVAETQGNLSKRIKDFDVAFDAVSDEHRLLGIHIAAARIGLQAMLQRAEGMRS
ncbi:toxic anion resistance protein, partial [Microbacterium sp. 18062]|uniref:toxic anion resistance protein n=1 Tax=Microbacterium sp. 18062 TaxID=2681410 RepID=UPI00190FA515